jgi:CDP-4-dehydro-6-deoxyglucose reductase, E1
MSKVKSLNWPLMEKNISRSDLASILDFLQHDDPVLTQSSQVQEFEKEWSAWLGVKHSVFVNSGSSANLLTMCALREHCGLGEIIVPTLTWVSDIASVVQCGFTPVFVDINPRTLGVDNEQVLRKITPRTKAVFLTHVLGYNALSQFLLDELSARGIALLEDVCESHGATFDGRKLGTFGLMSNFSFYYAHHMTTIEGGMISTDQPELYEILRMFRSHGLVREASSNELKRSYIEKYPDLNPEFIFAFPAYNVRSTEINATIGRSQLKRLNENNAIRSDHLETFLKNLDPAKYQIDFDTNGSSNYGLTLVLQHPDPVLCNKVIKILRKYGVKYRRGTAGGGNQLRQPYLKRLLGEPDLSRFPKVEHVHFYGFYFGNYPGLEREKIITLCALLNNIT